MSVTKRLIISQARIQQRVAELAQQIKADYQGQDLILVGVMNGVFIFMADLVRALDLPVQVDFVRLSSYGKSAHSSGQVKVRQDVSLPLTGRHVLVVEDIVDVGLTMDFLLKHLQTHQPQSLKVCSLIDKKERRAVPVPLDYVGFTVEQGFLVGYGLDYAENHRTYPEIYALEFT